MAKIKQIKENLIRTKNLNIYFGVVIFDHYRQKLISGAEALVCVPTQVWGFFLIFPNFLRS